eukprot:2700348-Prymnesium_polylepis.1
MPLACLSVERALIGDTHGQECCDVRPCISENRIEYNGTGYLALSCGSRASPSHIVRWVDHILGGAARSGPSRSGILAVECTTTPGGRIPQKLQMAHFFAAICALPLTSARPQRW